MLPRITIPIYRISETAFGQETEKALQKYLSCCEESCNRSKSEWDSKLKALYTQIFEQEKILPYSYNEIIGYIEMDINGSKITFDL